VRPASLIVKCAKEYEADVTFEVGGTTADPKSLFKLQTLEMRHGSTILIRAEGADAQAAAEDLARRVESFKEERPGFSRGTLAPVPQGQHGPCRPAPQRT
jgi:phosphocarrier protein HPr